MHECSVQELLNQSAGAWATRQFSLSLHKKLVPMLICSDVMCDKTSNKILIKIIIKIEWKKICRITETNLFGYHDMEVLVFVVINDARKYFT